MDTTNKVNTPTAPAGRKGGGPDAPPGPAAAGPQAGVLLPARLRPPRGLGAYHVVDPPASRSGESASTGPAFRRLVIQPETWAETAAGDG